MFAASAADADDHLAFAFLAVLGNQEVQHIQKLHQEFLGFAPLHHVFIDFRIHPGIGAQCLHIMGIRQKPHIKNQIRINGNAIFKAEGNHI
ncbi:hypothetical protein D3C76_1651630 [compost metagenome]